MRALALAAALAAITCGAALSGTALAQNASTWTDPAGRVSFTPERGWPVDTMSDSSPQSLHVVAGNANVECHVYAANNDATAGRPAAAVKRAYEQAFTAETWAQLVGRMRLFEDGVAVQSVSVDATRTWPVQRAVIASGSRTIHSALQGRPGLEVRTFCLTYNGSDASAAFDRFIASIATPQDAALQAQIDAEAAQTAAALAQQQAAQAQQEAAQAQQQQEQERRNRRR